MDRQLDEWFYGFLTGLNAVQTAVCIVSSVI
jgi:hypothetical protein